MKLKFISILLLITLIVPLAGTYWVLQKRKKVVRKEIKWKIIEGIDKQELVYLSFSKSEMDSKLKWKHSKEFEFDGEMYDIVEKVESQDSISYWCWWDYEETQLNKSLRNIVGKSLSNDPINQSNKNKLMVFFKSLYALDYGLELNLFFDSRLFEITSPKTPDLCKGFVSPEVLPPIA